jgi:nucleoside-diphosphate-sugar epimerase
MLKMNLDFSGHTVLVTGNAGFVGSHLTGALLQRGAKVIGLDNFFNGLESNVLLFKGHPNYQFHIGDVRDPTFLIDLTKKVDIIFHEAGFISVPLSIQMPALCHDINVTGTFNILNAARINDVERVVFASSAAVYGNDPTLPKQEKMLPEAISPYGASKIMGEHYLQTFYHTYGLKTTTLRYFNIYGPRQRHGAYAGVMAIFIENILKSHQAPTIFGDGTQTRDFIYIEDVIQANLLAALHPQAPGQIFNVATGIGTGLTQLTKSILKLTHAEELPIRYGPPRAGDILHSRADINKIRTILGFNPTFSMDQGLMEYINTFEINK